MIDSMVSCQACGKQIHSTAVMCPHCGTKQVISNNNKSINFKDALTTCIEKYATFSGRATRAEFWYFTLAIGLINIVTSMVGGLLVAITDVQAFSIFRWLSQLVFIVPSVSVSVRRMHDINKSGWYVLICWVGLVLLLLGLSFGKASTASHPNGFLSAIGVLMLLISAGLVIWQIVLYCTRGTQGTNQYGPA